MRKSASYVHMVHMVCIVIVLRGFQKPFIPEGISPTQRRLLPARVHGELPEPGGQLYPHRRVQAHAQSAACSQTSGKPLDRHCERVFDRQG